MTTTAPYGSWRSPITADLLVEKVVSLSSPMVDGETLAWVEARPAEGGRQAVVLRAADGTTADLLPPEHSARTLVHEYGGACTLLHHGVLFFSNFADQRVYRRDPTGDVTPITPEPPAPMAVRFADPSITPDGRWLFWVRERHEDGQVENDLVLVPADGSEPPRVVARGHDFYSAPRVSPDGRRLAWITWDHPLMPWDGTELWEADLADLTGTGTGTGAGAGVIGEPRLVAGGAEESVTQPRYAPDGSLHFVSDRTGWWNIYRDDGDKGVAVIVADAEFSGPDWVFGQSTYVFMDDGSLVAVCSQNGLDRIVRLPPGSTEPEPIETPYSAIAGIVAAGNAIVAVAGAATIPPVLVEMTLATATATAAARASVLPTITVIKTSRAMNVDSGYISPARPIEFPTDHGLSAHALFYPPVNADFVAPAGELPPLIVCSHGGPTSATSGVLNFGIQFWTSRGFAVVDVNYGGSTGYGRAYRDRLKGAWGIVDLADCVNAATWLADQGRVDGERMVIRGGSAGGYTTLCALTFTDVFAGGASRYGVADLGSLARDTHKFEARYLDGLVGRWPEDRAVYEQRSPIFHTDRLHTPLILLQGLEDKVVPPEQSEMMASALRDKGVPFAYVTYDGEQHGFRKAENIKHSTQAELSFYGAILGFTPADDIALPIENADAIWRRKAG